jgi:hypothetical protein
MKAFFLSVAPRGAAWMLHRRIARSAILDID